MAGAMMLSSSLPNKPESPACGFRPNTAILGFSIQKSPFKLSLMSANLLKIFSLVMLLGTSLKGTWPVTTPTRKSSPIKSMSESEAPALVWMYSVCPAKVKASLWMFCLLMGAVTRASISPAIKSLVARSKDKKAYFPPVSLASPKSIFTSSSQQLIILALRWCASAAWLITLKLKSSIPMVLRWKEATLVWPYTMGVQ